MPITCRNRHCPKCQGAAARDWLADREADLLPVGYFHLVFTLPAEIAPIAYQKTQWSTTCRSARRPRRCSPSPVMPLLRRPHDHRRELRVRRRTSRPAVAPSRG
jgi:hypothetical protein